MNGHRRQVIKEAIARVRPRFRLVLWLSALNLGFAVLSARPLSAVLQPHLDHRPAAAAMMNGDDGLALELASDHPEILHVAGASAQAALLLYGLCAWLLAGGVIATVALDDRRGAAAFFGSTLAHAGRMLKLGALGLVVRLVPIAASVGVWFALRPVWRGHGFARLALAMALLATIAGAAWSAATIALDYARGIAIADEKLPVTRAVRRGLALVVAQPGATVLLILFSAGGFALLTGATHGLAYLAGGGAQALVLQLALGVGRAALTTVTIVAAARLGATASLRPRSPQPLERPSSQGAARPETVGAPPE